MTRELTCIVCPVGCRLVAEIKDNGEVEVRGNSCPRGKVYAENECVAPMRTVTTTIRCESGEILPVKTDTPIPKEKIFEVMHEINRARAKDTAKIGDVIIHNVCSLGVDVIATSNT